MIVRAVLTIILEVAGGLLVVLLSTAIHETGHLASGLLAGFRFVSGRVGPFQVRCTPDWRITLKWRSFLGGSVAMRSEWDSTYPLLRHILFLLGGPFASLGLSILALLGCRASSGVLAAVLGFAFLVSGFTFVGTLLPGKGKSLDTDGRVLLDLIFFSGRRRVLLSKACFTSRLHAFRRLMSERNFDEAAEHLLQMQFACEARNGQSLQKIVDHLREHLENRESLEDCKWSPDQLST